MVTLGGDPVKDREDAQRLEKQKQKGALGKQVGGDHYKNMDIQPVEFLHKCNIPFITGCCIKYLSRWKNKNGVEDLEKTIHFIDMLLDMEKEHPGRSFLKMFRHIRIIRNLKLVHNTNKFVKQSQIRENEGKAITWLTRYEMSGNKKLLCLTKILVSSMISANEIVISFPTVKPPNSFVGI